MAITVAHLEAKIGADTSELERKAGSANSTIGGIGTKFAALAGAATLAGGAVVAGIGVKSVMAASDFAEQLSKVGVVFGEQGTIVTDYANQMARDFGIPKTQILDAASSIGLIGKASGMSQKDAAGMSTELAQMAIDASSFYNVPLDEALAAIRSGLVGEAEPMRRFGVLLNAQAVDAEAAKLGLEKVNGEYTEGAKAQARASLIMQGMSDASGDLERTQDGLANRMRELKGRAENAAITIGTALMPWVLKAMDAMERWGTTIKAAVLPVLENIKLAFDVFVKTFKDPDITSDGWVGQVEKIAGIARQVWDWINKLVDAFGGWGQVLKVVGGSVGGIIVALGAAGLVGVVGTVVAALTGTVGIIMAVAAAIGGLVVLLVKAYKEWEWFRTFVQNAVEGAKIALGVLMEWMNKLAAFTREIWPQVQEAIGHVLAVISSVIETFVGNAKKAWALFGDDVLRIVKGAWGAIQGVVQVVTSLISGIIRTVLAVINGDWGKAWEAIKNMTAGVWEGLKKIIGGALDIIKGILGAAWDFIKAAAAKAWEALKQHISDSWQRVLGIIQTGVQTLVGFFVALPGRLLDALKALPGMLSSAASTAWEFFKSNTIGKADEAVAFVRGLPGQILGALGDLEGKLREFGKQAIQGLINGIKAMLGAVKNAIGEIAGAVKDGIGKALKFGSPSKVMEQYGRWTSEGLANGIAQAQDEPVKAIVGLSNRLTDAFQPDLSMAVGGTGGGSAFAGGTGASRGHSGAVVVAPGAVQISFTGADVANLDTEGIGQRVDEAFQRLLIGLRTN